jgi:hypothetical protein
MRAVKTLLLLLSLGAASVTSPAAAPTAEDPVIELSLLDLMSIDYRPGKRLPKWARALDGRRVRVEGYMALGTPEGIDKFELVWDSCGCGQSNVNHFIEVTLTDETTTFDPDIIYVEGELSVGEIREDGFVVSLFRLKAQTVSK